MQICMDWRAIRFDWNRARAFLVTAEEGSLSRAARALGMSQPTLGRQVSALEKELGLSHTKNTSDDLLFTLETVACLGACGLAPAVVINDKVHGLMTPESTIALIKEIKETESHE